MITTTTRVRRPGSGRAARAVLTGQATAVPKNRQGPVESLRALTIARNSALKATTTASHEIKAILVGDDEALRDAMKVQSLLDSPHVPPTSPRSMASTWPWSSSDGDGSNCTSRTSSSTR